jgi:hypothetical protein
MLSDATTVVQVAVVLYIFSLLAWGLVWFYEAYAIGDSYPQWHGQPPSAPPRQVKLGLGLLTLYPLVTTSVGIGAWVCRVRDVEPAGFVLTRLVIAASSAMLVPFCCWILLVMAIVVHEARKH